MSKKFTGITLMPFELRLNPMDGFGFSVLSLNVCSVGYVSHSVSYALFSINYRKHYTGRGGWQKAIWISAFGFGRSIVLSENIAPPEEEVEDWDHDGWS